MAICDATFTELRQKDVINICDCRKLGRICDIVIDLRTGKVRGIVLPGKGFNIFRQPQDIFIPWKNILRIGGDVILVEIVRRLRDCNDKKSESNEDMNCEVETLDARLHSKALKYLTDDDDDNESEEDDK
jgi:YlmC/YmxH family sporulation protein